jgi:hypothetical protein
MTSQVSKPPFPKEKPGVPIEPSIGPMYHVSLSFRSDSARVMPRYCIMTILPSDRLDPIWDAYMVLTEAFLIVEHSKKDREVLD